MIDTNGTRTLNPDDVRDALSDAIADMAHVLEAESSDSVGLRLDEEIRSARPRGMRHYRAERGEGDSFSPTIIVEGC